MDEIQLQRLRTTNHIAVDEVVGLETRRAGVELCVEYGEKLGKFIWNVQF